MNVLVLDIETTPFRSYHYSQWQTNIYPNQVTQVPEVLCFAWKWHGRSPVHFEAGKYHPDQDSDRPMAEMAYSLMNTADAIVDFNGKKFDKPHLNRLIRRYGGPPSPYDHVDLRPIIKREFAFPYNSLDYICGELGLGTKRKSKKHGIELWVRCMEGDPEAWRDMEIYNKQDVRLTDKLYDFCLPWIQVHPNVALIDELPDGSCTRCGSRNITRQGFRRTKTRSYPRFRCNNCKGWLKGTRSADSSGMSNA